MKEDAKRMIIGQIASYFRANNLTIKEALNLLDEMKDFLLCECIVANKYDLKD